MRLVRVIWFRLRALLRGRRLNAEFDEELRFHIDRETYRNVDHGMDPDEARRIALVQFGGIERFKEELHDQRSVRWLQDGVKELRYSVRRLRKHPLYCGAVILTLAIGIGVTSTIFTLVNGLLLRPLPYPNADRVVSLSEGKDGQITHSVGRANFTEWRNAPGMLADIAAYNVSTGIMIGAGDPVHLVGAQTTASFFDVLGVPAAIGRVYRADEEVPGDDAAVVLGDALWRTTFGADSNVIGRTVVLDDAARIIVGVMPAGFNLPDRAQYWIPLPHVQPGARTRPYVRSIALLAPGTTHEVAQAQLQAVLTRADDALQASQRGRTITITTLRDELFGSVKQPLLLLFGAVCTVLLIAAINLTALSMAQAATRQREVAVRLALGARRWRIVRQLLFESSLLAAAGGALGLLMPLVLVPILVGLSPESVAGVSHFAVDATVVVFVALATLIVLLVSSLAPAVVASRGAPAGALSAASTRLTGSRAQSRMRAILVIAELGAALMLITGAGLLTRSLVNAMSIDTGFDTSHVFATQIELPYTRYSESQDVWQFYNRLAAEVRSLPGVQNVALSDGLPLYWYTFSQFLRRAPDEGSTVEVAVTQVDAHYHAVLGLRLLEGRFIDASDRSGTVRSAVITASAAQALFPDGQAIGRSLSHSFSSDSIPPVVVGIVDDVAQTSAEAAPLPQLFLPLEQADMWPTFLTIRGSGDMDSYRHALTRSIHAIDPNLVLTRIEKLDERLDHLFAPRRFNSILVSAFAGLALLLAVVGLYGLIAQGIAVRRNEFGIRMALGAQTSSILSLVLRQSFTIVTAGILFGVALSWAFSRVLSSLLFGISATDPLVLVGATLVLASVAAFASYIPARRATLVDPVQSLRHD